MKKNTPPRTGGLKVSARYSARIGQARVCAKCGHEYEISLSTFAPSNASTDDVATVCRKCQGGAAYGLKVRADVLAVAREAARGSAVVIPSHSKDPRGYWKKVGELTARLYEIAGAPEHEAEYLGICDSLNAVTRLVGDPAGGGKATDAELAFRTFWAVLRPIIANATDLAAIHDDIIRALLDPADRVLLLASRNSGKSTLAQVYAAWLLHRNPLDVVVVISGGERLAKQCLRTVRGFIERCPLVAPLRPDEECLDSAFQFTVPAANGRLGAATSFSAFGITSSMTGFRANRILFDDVETRKMDTPEAQENLDDRTTEAEHLLNPGGRVLALGTPQVAGLSIYARWKGSGRWACHLARLFDEIDEGNAKPSLVSRWPARWSDADLEKKRRSMPARDWSLHWRIELSAEQVDETPIRLQDFITVRADPLAMVFPQIVRPGGDRLGHLSTGVADANDFFRGPAYVSPETARYIHTVAAVDPASGVAGRDEVGVSIVSVTTQGRAVVRCVTGIRGSSASEALQNVASLIHQFYPTKVVCEARADSLYPSQLASVLARRGYPVTVETVHSGTRKGDRIIDAIVVPLADQRVILLEAVVSGDDAQETIKQLTHVTRDGRKLKHDDRVDALSWALAAVAPSIQGREEDGIHVPAQQKLEELLRLPLRMGGIADDSPLVAMYETDEEYERLKYELDQLLATQEQELRRGHVDPAFAKYIESVRRELNKYRHIH